MALIADPQLVDPHTYAHRGLILEATMFYTDLFMARSYSLLNKILLPQSIIFLGDLLDGGREWSTSKDTWKSRKADPRTPGREDWDTYDRAYWEKEFVRFNDIFPVIPGRRSIRTLPGNHDLGIGNGVNEGVATRFKAFFGDTNSVHTIGNHTFVLIDSVSLENTENPKIYEPPRRFLDEFTSTIPSPRKILQQSPELRSSQVYNADKGGPPATIEAPIAPLPKILLTHVPLYRLPNTPCGPLREKSKAIEIRGGFQYQNVLLYETSADVLKKVKPVLVASGDDHDHCEVTHTGATGMVKEITVKSFSMAMGMKRPGFLMLSLWNPVKEGVIEGGGDPSTVQAKLCLLPDQMGIWKTYVLLFGITKFMVTLSVVWAWYKGRKGKGNEPLLPLSQDEATRLKRGQLNGSSEYIASSVSSSWGGSNGNSVSTRNSGSSVHSSPGSSRSHYGGYGIPSNTSSPAPPYNDDDDDKYAKKSMPGLGIGAMPPGLQHKIDRGLIELGNAAGNVGSRVAEKVVERVPSLAPTVERGKEIVRREMEKGGIKGFVGRVWAGVKEWGMAVIVLGIWYALLVFRAA